MHRPRPHRSLHRIAGLSALTLAILPAPASADAPGQGALAAYVRARAADAGGDGAAALDAYRAALAGAPDNPLVAIRAYREALAAGDAPLARSAAAVLSRAGVAPADAALLPLAAAARAGDGAAVERALDLLATDRFRVLIPAIRLWLGREMPEPADAAARRLFVEARALHRIATGRMGEGFAAVVTLAAAPGPPSEFRLSAAERLIATGHPEEAARVVGDDASALAVARLGTGATADIGWGVSRLLARVAADLVEEPSAPVGIALARAAIEADPGFVRGRAILATQLALGGDTTRALAALDTIDAPALAPRVAAQRVDILNRADRLGEAIRFARPLAEAREATPRDRARLADLLFADGRPREALPLYARTLRDGDAKGSWAAWLRYGGALDEAGKWREAERALRRALRLAPDEPTTLNYLGYTLVDRRQAVAEGTAMLERAHRLAPDDAAIADSLGWAYHVGGDTPRALPLVEGAAAALPTDPEVGDHLGDLYWSLGRRYEARYAWTAAQVTAAPLLRARIAEKLAR